MLTPHHVYVINQRYDAQPLPVFACHEYQYEQWEYKLAGGDKFRSGASRRSKRIIHDFGNRRYAGDGIWRQCRNV